MKFFASEKLGSKRQTTPEGYLLIEETPVARTGIQIYLPQELGNKIKGDANGEVKITRSPEEVFSPVSIASLNGKPFTNDHPNDLVGPLTWRELSRGVVMNARRGEGELADHLVCDLLITDYAMIELVNSGKVELSCGYNAEYLDTGVGTGEQINIVHNHLALVGEGRCGPTCAISDHSKCNPNNPNPETKMKRTLRDKLMGALGVTDKAGLEKALDEATEGGGLHIHMVGGADEEADPMEAFGKRMDALEGGMKTISDYITAKSAEDKARDEKAAKDAAEKEEKEKAGGAEDAEKAETEKELEDEAPEGEAKEAKEAKDSRYLADAFQNSVAMAEILVPGFSAPSFDKAAAPKGSVKAICDFRKRVLDAAFTTTDGRVILNDLLGGKTLDTSKLSCAQTRSLFFGAAAAKKQMNNTGGGHTGDRAGLVVGAGGKAIRSVGDLQRRANEIYSGKKPEGAAKH